MRILARRSKYFLLVGLGLFLGTYVLLNYTDFNSHLSGFSGNNIEHDHHLDLNQHHHHRQHHGNGDSEIKTSITKIDKLNKYKPTNASEESPSKKRGGHFFAYDAGGFSSVNLGVNDCGQGIQVEVVNSLDPSKTDFSYFHMSVPSKESLTFKGHRHYSMVFTMESEPHSHGGETWENADFRMWYNLDLSFPEPATYFDVRPHLLDLLSPPYVDFGKKETSAKVVWIVSNCNAYNGREKYMKKLMAALPVHSYGGCLQNKNSHPTEHMKGNIELFAKYKFVIAIENSNCVDYVTEKLVHAVASGSVPIVAGKDGKPDYLRFLPKGSYINIYDFKSPEELANHIVLVSSSKEEYEKYIKFKFNHNYTREDLKRLSLPEIIQVAKSIMDPGEKFFSELVAKEKSENKLCKLAKYLNRTPADVVEKEIAARKINRPSTVEACLQSRNLEREFVH